MAWSKRKKKGCIFIGTPNYGKSDQFTIKLRHGGKLANGLTVEYIGGKCTWFDYFDPELMSFIELKAVIKEAGVIGEDYIVWHRLPNLPPDIGLRIIENDVEAFEIGMFLPDNKVVELFVELTEGEGAEPIKTKKSRKRGGNLDGAGTSNASKNLVHSEDEEDSFHESLHDSEYSSESDECEKVDNDKGKTVVSSMNEGEKVDKDKGKSVLWSISVDVKSVNIETEYDSDDGLRDYESGSDGGKGSKSRGRVFNPKVDMEKPQFELKMEFKDHKVVQEAIRRHAILEGRQIFFTKQNRDKVSAVCKGPCEWKIYASRSQHEANLVVKTLQPVHSCPTHYKNHHVKSKWLAKTFVDDWRSNPTKPLKAFQQEVFTKTNVHITKHQAYRAKEKAFKLIQGSVQDQYSLLWDYAEELRNRNPGSSVYLKVEEGSILRGYPVLERLYVCLSGLKEAVKLCRKVISVDGCFLKGEFGGQLLAACGVDPNNNWFPLCWAIVEAETKETWNWFFAYIVEDLEITNSQAWTIISDKQKGLIDAVSSYMPDAEHRFCVFHMLGNMRGAGFKGLVYKDYLWGCASATTKARFKHFMGELEKYDKKAYEWLVDKSPEHWSRSHFRCDNQCDILLNNLSESFNSFILPARDQPVLACLEGIRNLVMVRMEENRVNAEKWKGTLCPKIHKEMEKRKKKVSECIPTSCGGGKYQVSCMSGSQYSVNVEDRTCTCRKWQLSGLPCHHAISCMFLREEEAELYVHDCYRISTYKKIYAYLINPMDSPDMWARTMLPEVHPPPTKRRQPGRPKKLRKKTNVSAAAEVVEEAGEPREGRQKLGRKEYQRSLLCSLCKVSGHNKRSCPLRSKTGNNGGEPSERSNALNEEGEIPDAVLEAWMSIGQEMPQEKEHVEGTSQASHVEGTSQVDPLVFDPLLTVNNLQFETLNKEETSMSQVDTQLKAVKKPRGRAPKPKGTTAQAQVRLPKSNRLRARWRPKPVEGLIDLTMDVEAQTMSQPNPIMSQTTTRVITQASNTQPPPGVMFEAARPGRERSQPNQSFKDINVNGGQSSTSRRV